MISNKIGLTSSILFSTVLLLSLDAAGLEFLFSDESHQSLQNELIPEYIQEADPEEGYIKDVVEDHLELGKTFPVEKLRRKHVVSQREWEVEHSENRKCHQERQIIDERQHTLCVFAKLVPNTQEDTADLSEHRSLGDKRVCMAIVQASKDAE